MNTDSIYDYTSIKNNYTCLESKQKIFDSIQFVSRYLDLELENIKHVLAYSDDFLQIHILNI